MHIYIDDNSNPLKEFQLPANFTPELSRTNPFLTDEGSQSIPLTLPASEHNLRLVGFLHRGAFVYRPQSKILVVLSEGSLWQRGNLVIGQVNKKEGIDCTVYMNEGELYEKIKDYKLRDLGWLDMPGLGVTVTMRAKYWMNRFLDIIQKKIEQPEEYYICNVWSESEFYVGSPKKGDYLMLNELSFKDNVLSFYAMEEQKYYEQSDDEATEITAPVGFGITPFLRLGYVLRTIFKFFGYTLDANIFDTNESLKRVVVLNNVADAIVDGYIHFKQLLPDVSVEDFLKAVRIKFGLEFIQKGNHISIKTWTENLHSLPDMDLISFIRNTKSYVLEEKKALSIEFQALTDHPHYRHTRSVEDLKKRNDSLLTHLSPSGFVEESLDIMDKTPYFYNGLSGYMQQEGIEGYAKSLELLFINAVKYFNSDLIINGELNEDSGENMDISFCFSETSLSTFRNTKKYIASRNYSDYLSLYATSVMGSSGSMVYENNIYEVLYKDRDKMLQQANQQIIYEAVIPAHIINSMDISTPKIIDGQKVLIERIDYVIGRPDLCQITARTLHLMEDK